jgi:hypothetical protein
MKGFIEFLLKYWPPIVIAIWGDDLGLWMIPLLVPVALLYVLILKPLYPDIIDMVKKQDPYLWKLREDLSAAEEAGDKEEIERLSTSIYIRTGHEEKSEESNYKEWNKDMLDKFYRII